MSFDSFWARILPKNPELSEDDGTLLRMPVRSFREAMSSAYIAGRADGIESTKTTPLKPIPLSDSLFLQEFGESMSQAVERGT